MEGAQGPNTGGMGAVCPLEDVTAETMAQFEKNILQPTLKGLVAEKMDYRGFIFFGLMITKDGPKALEYNVRLGDPETQAVLPMMDFDFAELCQAIMNGTLDSFEMKWKSGYPLKYAKGKVITIAEPVISHAGAKNIYSRSCKRPSLRRPSTGHKRRPGARMFSSRRDFP